MYYSVDLAIVGLNSEGLLYFSFNARRRNAASDAMNPSAEIPRCPMMCHQREEEGEGEREADGPLPHNREGLWEYAT